MQTREFYPEHGAALPLCARPEPVLQYTKDKKTYLRGVFDFDHSRAPVPRPVTRDTPPESTWLDSETVVSFDGADEQVQDLHEQSPTTLHAYALSSNFLLIVGKFGFALTL